MSTSQDVEFLILLFLSVICLSVAVPIPCVPRDFGKSSTVCVCNATYCDTVEPNTNPGAGMFNFYESTRDGKRLTRSVGKFTNSSTGYVFAIHPEKRFQSILGFGGAFTDAAGINIASLSVKSQDNLLRSYYSPDGLEYTVGRVPMASCDFSTHPYSYDDTDGDLELKSFSLAPEDIKYKIPIIQKAMSLNSRNISIFGSPWSAPAWMKTDKNMTGKGSLIGQAGGKYYEAWALYFVKFLQEYSKHNIKMWGITAQNEPTDGGIPKFPFQSMGWTPVQQRDFIAHDLGPALHKYGFDDVKLMILDDQRILLPYWAEQVFSSPDAMKYVSGIAVHWYMDAIAPTDSLKFTHDKFPDKFILATEACEGDLPWEEKVELGSWERAESYAHDIIQDLNQWVIGWTDWNIALDMEGGPNWVKNFVDSPIIVNAKQDEFYKQPMFYAIGHFSKFILPSAVRIGIETSSGTETDLEMVALTQPDNSIVIVILNRSSQSETVSIKDPQQGYIVASVPAHSIRTYTW